MRALNPFTGEFYLETLHVARYTREMYCLFGGRHTHPSTIMPGGCSADITHQTCTDYYVRLMRYFDYVKRSVPMHDDLYDFFLQELPGYDMVGYRETNLVNWGCFDDPDYVDYDYRNMTEWGRKRYITPGVAIDGELISTDLVEINLMIRILLGSSYFDSWENEPTLRRRRTRWATRSTRTTRGTRSRCRKPQKRDFTDKYTWVVSPRIYDKRTDTHVCCDTGGGPFARQWCTAKAGLVDFGYVKATGHSLQMVLPRSPNMPEMELEWKVPEKSNAIERDRARTYHQAYAALIALHCLERAMKEVQAGRTKSWNNFKVPDSAVSCGFHEAARGVLSHHMVIRDGKIANYQPYPPTPWNASPRDVYGTPGPVRGRGAEHADLRGERPGELQGHRHHAGGALVRPVPALRRAHVHRRRQGAQGDPHADGAGVGRRTMAVTAATEGPDELVVRVQELQARLDAAGDAATRELAEELVSAVVQMYGAGLERIVDVLLAAGEEGERLAMALADDPLVATLLLIHDLHPVPLEPSGSTRRSSRCVPYMESHGGNVELLSLEDGVARLRLRGQLLGLLGVGGDARAGDQAGARGGRARPRRAGGRGRRWTPSRPPTAARCTAPRASPAPAPIVGRGRAADRAARRRAGGGRGRAAPSWWWPTSSGTLLAYATAAPAAAARCTTASWSRARCAARTAPHLLPAARRALDGRRAAAARAGAAAARAGHVKVALAT